ncbi:ImuA family protein [Terrimonas pollutisoli]|uniref:ImuA family protein n=1 Tax=Terrimonas pollutisoli TaxID=3034147 RepID=UPI0023EE0E52|nr:Error-prone repair protein ImuA [Terrimonas sp. H1YJ31]
MPASKADIIAKLQKDLLPLQGLKRVADDHTIDTGLGPINYAFPNGEFPLGAIHEFIAEDIAATGGFVAGILSALMQNGSTCLWISSYRTLFPPALHSFGISPDKIIFIDLQKERDLLWAMEEALKCNGLAAVVGEIKELSFTASRRLQLAVEQSRVTGFILRAKANNTTACVTRWNIASLPGELNDDMPGIGFPRWNIQLLKVRNGKPGSWQVEWVNRKFRPVFDIASLIQQRQKKVG